jgi:hypothetical protein
MEMWIWRKMENILWSDKLRNEEVLRRVGEVRKLVNLIRYRKGIGYCILKEVLERRMEGKRRRGRPRKRMLDQLIVSMYEDMKRRAEKRGTWGRWLPWDWL